MQKKLNGPPTAVKKMKGDGNNLFCVLWYRATGFEVAHLKVRNAICDNIAETNTYTVTKWSTYMANTKMTSLTTEGMDVELLVAAQLLGIVVHITTNGGRDVSS